MAGITAALGHLTAAHAAAMLPTLTAPALLPSHLEPDWTPPLLSRASTPKQANSVRLDK